MAKLAVSQSVVESGVFGQQWSGRSDSIVIDVIQSGITLDVLHDALEDAAIMQTEPYAIRFVMGSGELRVPKHFSLALACKRNDHSIVAVRTCRTLMVTLSRGDDVALQLQCTEVNGKISALLHVKFGHSELMRTFFDSIQARKAEAALMAGPSTPAPAEDDEHTRTTWRPTAAAPRITTVRPPHFDPTQGFVSIPLVH